MIIDCEVAYLQVWPNPVPEDPTPIIELTEMRVEEHYPELTVYAIEIEGKYYQIHMFKEREEKKNES